MTTGEAMRIIVAGSRSFDCYWLLESKLDFYIGSHQPAQIINSSSHGFRLGWQAGW
jgi:hypothetical protein